MTEDEGVDRITIGDQEILLAAGQFSELVWVLLNLIFAGMGMAVARRHSNLLCTPAQAGKRRRAQRVPVRG